MANSVLVIGAGIAGIEAALNLANYGFKVYLLDNSPSIGGIMARLDKTFPTNDCSICIEAPKMYEVQKHPNIELLTYSDVRRVEKTDKGFKVKIMKKARYIDEEKCKGCGKCAEACPVEVFDELDGKIGGKRKLIYIPFPQAVPNYYVLDPQCRKGKMREKGACIGGCIIDCSQCRECPIAKCVKACKEEGADAVMLWQRNKFIDVEVSSIIVSVGLDVLEPPEGFYGYGKYQNVLTHYQYERLMNAGGPTEGNIIKPSDNNHPRTVTWIQCVGREKEIGVPYCSKVCCMVAMKQAIITKEHNEKIETNIIYTDLKTYGKGFYDFYRKALELGVKFIKGKPADVYEDQKDRSLKIRYENLDKGEIEELKTDILVLSTALVPGKENKKLSRILGIELNEYGFFKEKNPLKSFETNVEGIYVCGGALGPTDISEAVIQAIGASMKAVSRGV